MYLWMRISFQQLQILVFQAFLIDLVVQERLPEHLITLSLILGNNGLHFISPKILYILRPHQTDTWNIYFQCVVCNSVN
jgi:hypothetical protein